MDTYVEKCIMRRCLQDGNMITAHDQLNAQVRFTSIWATVDVLLSLRSQTGATEHFSARCIYI